jgi:osmotically-inducible protein OsmY
MNIRKTIQAGRSLIGLLTALGLSAAAQAHAPSTFSDDDRQLAERVATVLQADPRIEVLWPLHVAAYNGTVRITGRVRSVPMIYRAVELTRTVDGVEAIDVEQLESR